MTGPGSALGWAAVLVRDMNDVPHHPRQGPDEIAAGLPDTVADPDRATAHVAVVLARPRRGADRAAGRQAER